MTIKNLPRDGGCRCGEVRFRVSAPPILTAACHCTGCQRMTGSAYSLSVAIPSEGFEVTQGEPIVGGLRSPDLHHLHCPSCLSWMFTRIEGMDGFVNLRPTMLDDPSWFSPFVEVWTSEALPWAATGAPHSFETQPEFEGYMALAQEYAERLAKEPS